jgi:hypothetical protein
MDEEFFREREKTALSARCWKEAILFAQASPTSPLLLRFATGAATLSHNRKHEVLLRLQHRQFPDLYAHLKKRKRHLDRLG